MVLDLRQKKSHNQTQSMILGWNLDQEKTCTVKGVLNQRIYKQYSLRAKITNACLDICLFLIFIVSHTELNRFGLVL